MDDLQIKSESLQELYSMWKTSSDEIPHEREIDPYLFPKKLFPYLVLYEVHYEPMRFLAKLAGNALSHHVGKEFQGRFLDEINPDGAITPVIEWHEKSVLARKASLTKHPFITGKGEKIKAYRLFLPYCNDQGVISKFISAAELLEDDRSFILP